MNPRIILFFSENRRKSLVYKDLRQKCPPIFHLAGDFFRIGNGGGCFIFTTNSNVHSEKSLGGSDAIKLTHYGCLS